ERLSPLPYPSFPLDTVTPSPYPLTIMDADENPYQAQFDQWDRYYKTVVLPQQHLLLSDAVNVVSYEYATYNVGTARQITLGTTLLNPDVDIPLTSRESYSEDFYPIGDSEQELLSRLRTVSAFSSTSSTFTAPHISPSEACIFNQMHNKYALSPETSAYANELVGIFADDHEFENVDDPENLRHTYLRDFSKLSMEDLRALPDPFPPKMRYLFE
ncbi:hypothetical protein PENTCL1PPCAC_7774, partial [Pristionchus entomophagus]